MKYSWIIVFLVRFICCFAVQQGDLDSLLSSKGLINIRTLDSTICVELKYAQQDNFMNQAVYKGLSQAWLRFEAAGMLVKAQRLLKLEHPAWTIVVYDAARPMSVQRKMWSLVRGTDKTNYVSNPANGGGLHNYGMAVDVTILDETGIPLPMGSPFDYFGEEAHTSNEEALLKQGKINQQEYNNRRLLRRVMTKAGFRIISYEWWHFNACSRTDARRLYPVID
ncbi:M15 family metallopeptidase [Parabacteroides chinchillae]|uniref:D-alanyl-D-alanine dipeptidase n=1 Tax=Parabacteroides chinchillae TaxID=871327 RepID=A0A8G2F471_9BACT|nr:M15 family metallopeptidase [Parabacteroides chinchillae]SEF58812.1 D-alanyl-D-alanine dipeptidase [Parabacteroides chinchillae]